MRSLKVKKLNILVHHIKYKLRIDRPVYFRKNKRVNLVNRVLMITPSECIYITSGGPGFFPIMKTNGPRKEASFPFPLSLSLPWAKDYSLAAQSSSDSTSFILSLLSTSFSHFFKPHHDTS